MPLCMYVFIFYVCLRCFRTVRWETFLFTFYFYSPRSIDIPAGNNIIYYNISFILYSWKICVSIALNLTLNIIQLYDGIYTYNTHLSLISDPPVRYIIITYILFYFKDSAMQNIMKSIILSNFFFFWGGGLFFLRKLIFN